MKLTMLGRLSRCYLLAYRTPAESVRSLVPAGLELVTRGPWAFWNVVVCAVEKMRPVGAARWCGVSYHHVAYRLYVKAATVNEGRVRGLFFVRSDADHALIARGGNLASDFKFNAAAIAIESRGEIVEARVTGTKGGRGDGVLRARSGRGGASDSWDEGWRRDGDGLRSGQPGRGALRAGSCFDLYEGARAALKYQPLGLSVSRDGRRLKLAEVFRDESAWRERPVEVEEARFDFFEALGQPDMHLEMATEVDAIDYRWRLGRTVELVRKAVEIAMSPREPASISTRRR